MLRPFLRNKIVASVIVVILAVLALVLFVKRTPPHVTTCVFGDVQAHLQAYVPVELQDRYLDAKKMQFGLGSAAIGGWDSLGDALAVGGNVWLRTTNAHSPRFYALVSNRYFQSNAFAYIPLGVVAKTQWRLNSGLSFSQLWQNLGKTYPGGVMAAGYIHVQDLRTIAIAHPPIRAMPILSNAQFYYTEPMESAKDLWVYAVSIVARTSHLGWHDNLLARLIAKETNEDIQGQTYVLRLSSAPVDFSLPPAKTIIENLGQVVGDSTLLGGTLQIYPIITPSLCETPTVVKNP